MQEMMRGLSDRLYADQSFVQAWRTQRFRAFLSLVKPPQNARIIDLGGTPYMWDLVQNDFNVTLVNLPGTADYSQARQNLKIVEADATRLQDLFADQSFDVVYSNSVIEHVGDRAQQAAFAREAKRLGKAYWVQTPSNWFPVEVHTGVPFYWLLPEAGRNYLKQRWHQKLPAWTEMIEQTTVLTCRELKDLFPEAQIYREWRLLFEKSYAAYVPYSTTQLG
jgi:trans-aconitate methyltransferase